jgi:hypothetical protein
MKLNLDVADLEISTNKMVHFRDRVYIRFRRQPDSDVVNDILSLASDYGWLVEDHRNDSDISKVINEHADFVVVCTGAESHEVGNAIADYLLSTHNLITKFYQRITFKEGFSRVEEVDRLILGGIRYDDV